ncbi:MAG: hypothetical protein HN886_04730 [Woeseiaceae bacterium]|nr:hypothetical protein [Woeseiaceae bacterium]
MIKINGQINNQSPISKLIMAIGGIVALGFFVFLGAIAFIIIGGLILSIWLVIRIRFWWLTRSNNQFKQSKTDSQHKKKSSKGVLEGEFHEIDKKDS